MEEMKETIKELDVVALVRDHPERKLVAGQVGTVVEVLAAGIFEVEFCDDSGRAYAMMALKEQDLIVLHYAPFAAV
jgi:hypothetical protein